MAAIQGFVDQQVQVVLYDGRIIVVNNQIITFQSYPGKLQGFDARANVIMSDCVEREFSAEDGVEMIPLGLYMIKGDNVAIIGEVDTDKDATIDFSTIRAEPLGTIHH